MQISKRALMAVVCGACALPAAADKIDLSGTVRDFKRGDQSGGHPDFETCSTTSGHGSYGLVTGLVTMDFGAGRLPVYNTTRPSNDSMSGATNFNQWFKDTLNVNQSQPFTITLDNGKTTKGGLYTYENQSFFPIDGKMFGNQAQKDGSGTVHNFSFTYELHTQFSYIPGQKFTFIGDDDVWVYINGTKVIDIGGVHSAATANVLLFDGKAFLTKANFTAGGKVKTVDSTMASALATKWSNLGMSGTCPIAQNDLYVDMGVVTIPEVAVTFPNTTSATVKSTDTLSSAVVKYTDGTEQTFGSLSGKSATLSGTGSASGKAVSGVWVKTANAGGTDRGPWFGMDGSGGLPSTLDFFFAERHTTESHFRIDTSILLAPSPITTTITPLFD